MISRKNFRRKNLRKKRTKKQKGGMNQKPKETKPKIGIALIAHAGMKGVLRNIISDNFDKIKQNKLCIYGTKTTIESIKLKCNEGNCQGCETKEIKSGPQGGDSQISALIVLSQSHYHEINALCRVAEMNNIAVAYNPRTARILINDILEKIDRDNLFTKDDSIYDILFEKQKNKTNSYQSEVGENELFGFS